MQRISVLVLALMCCSVTCRAQAPTAVVNGQVRDTSGAAIAGASVEVFNDATHVRYSTETNDEGIYSVPSLPPGTYHIQVSKPGFKTVVHPDITLHVQDAKAIGFTLPVGPVSETITVEGGVPLINTESAAVSTVVDRQFVENLPLNGRSFQTLIALSPGVVVTPSGQFDPGQFSVNGQRASANYFTVDGVSANIGVLPGSFLSQTAGGSIPGFSVTGGTNNLVSEDALQEFRIQTSTFAPEFGRTPGAQVSIVTRSGTNEFHGTLFEFLRNDKLDANDWFSNQKGLRKSEERINDFGGVLGGPILKNRTFFFLSYEGQRLRLPQTKLTTVPSLSARQSASADIQPYLNAYPVPNGPEILDANGNPTGQAPFNGGFSDQSTLNATSIRIDHTVNSRLTLFARYNHAPSDSLQRGVGGTFALNTLSLVQEKTQTLTLGGVWSITPRMNSDFHFNYSRTAGTSSSRLDSFGGAVVPPESALGFPAPFSSGNATFDFDVFGLQNGIWELGKIAENLQRQLNFVDNLSLQRGSHSLKFGVDYRRLSPVLNPAAYSLFVGFNDVPSVLSGTPSEVNPGVARGATVLFRNLSLFAQDNWRVKPRLVITYGLRWDVDFTPSTIDGPDLAAVSGFNDLNTLALAPPGTPVFKTKYDNFSPRIGVAYQLRPTPGRETVLRGGFGVYYDLATVQVGGAVFSGYFPFGASKFFFSGVTFPLAPTITQPPPFVCPDPNCEVGAFDPDLKPPRTFQWNATLQQSLGNKQALSVAYVGALGRHLLQDELVFFFNQNFLFVELGRNAATSDYHSLQLQFERRLSKGVQALASYTWSHSIDSASSSSGGVFSDAFSRTLGQNVNRGPSDFDIRQTFSAAVTYGIPAPRANRVMHAMLRDWAVQNILEARSAPPLTVFDPSLFFLGSSLFAVRPDVIPGVPLFLKDATVAGGRRINPAAFIDPPTDPTTGVPLRQGTLGRNALRGFGAAQWDFAVRREFPLHEPWRLQFRAEFFNLLNHPNFANPIGDLSSPFFGQSITTLARGLKSGGASSGGSGGFAPIFQLGGPRSIQFGLKLVF